jgi:hypothetical protein
MDKYNEVTVLIIGSHVGSMMIVKNKKNPVNTKYIYRMSFYRSIEKAKAINHKIKRKKIIFC